MPSKDTSNLYSGMTSRSAQRVQESREVAKQEKREKRIQLNPTVELIKEEFAKEIDQLNRLDLMNVESLLDQEHLAAELMARKKTTEHLQRIQRRILNIMREPKLALTPEIEGFGNTDSPE